MNFHLLAQVAERVGEKRQEHSWYKVSMSQENNPSLHSDTSFLPFIDSFAKYTMAK